MANITNSPNMSLPIPVVGVENGPQYATDINSSLTIVDLHNHSPGYGVQITPSGLNINADLPFNANNATQLRSVRFNPNASVLNLSTDLGCLYEAGVDLYYNDGNGNQIQLTKNGSIAGTAGSISGLVSPASASYIPASQTFVWQSAANTPANMDFASATLRNLTINSFGYTVNPPNSLAADANITLPSVPSQINILSMDTSGNIFANVNVDNSTLQFTSNTLSIKPQGVVQNDLAPRTVTVNTTAPAGGVAFSTSTTTSSPNTNVLTNVASAYITTTGRPVMIMLQPDGNTTNPGFVQNPTGNSIFALFRGSTQLNYIESDVTAAMAPGVFSFIDTPPAGTYSYFFKCANTSSVGPHVFYCVLVAYEL